MAQSRSRFQPSTPETRAKAALSPREIAIKNVQYLKQAAELLEAALTADLEEPPRYIRGKIFTAAKEAGAAVAACRARRTT